MIQHKIEQAVGAYKFGDKSIIPSTEDVEGHPINVLLKYLDKPKRLSLKNTIACGVYPQGGRTPLMKASENDNKEVVTCLVEAKANLDLQSKVPSFPRDDEYSAMIMVVMITR